MTTYTTGDVLENRTRDRTRYVRVAYTDPRDAANGHVAVQTCDGAGFLLRGDVRLLKASTLQRSWHPTGISAR